MTYKFRYLSTLLIMSFDVVSGVLKTKINRRKISSTKMSIGLYKKTATLVCLATADLLQYVLYAYMQTDTPLSKAVYCYILITEAVSVYENAGDMKLTALLKRLLKIDGGNDGKTESK